MLTPWGLILIAASFTLIFPKSEAQGDDSAASPTSVTTSTTLDSPEYGTWTVIRDEPCSATCGGGVLRRFRSCLNAPSQESCAILGPDSDTVECSTEECPSCKIKVDSFPFENGVVRCTDGSLVGSTCTFECDETHQLVGLNKIICESGDLASIGVWNARTPICAERCTEKADIVFVIDSSSSIGRSNFEIIRSFIRQVVKRFDVGPEKAAIGAIRYNRVVERQFHLKEFKTKQSVLRAISTIPYDGSGTVTGKAINYTREFMFTPEAGHRPNVSKIAVVITDGIAFDDVFIPSQLLKEDGTIVIAVGIGNIRIGQIYQIASNPDQLFATTVSDFYGLDKVVKAISDQMKLCTQPALVEVAQCPPHAVMDLLFVVDSSSSMGSQNFDLVRRFISGIVGTFKVGTKSARFGLIRYSSQPTTEFNLLDYKNKADIQNAITRMPYTGSGTQTGRAISYAVQNGVTTAAGRRGGDVPLVVVVFTDGKSTDDVRRPANALRNVATTVIAIGVGNALRTELRSIASHPVASNAIEIADFNELDKFISQIATTVCFGAISAKN